MADLSRLVAAPGAHALSYTDAMFPGRPLKLHAARPQCFTAETPILLVHHGIRRNGAAYRDYWLPLVDAAGVCAIAIEFSEAFYPDYLCYHFGNRHAADGTPNPRAQWTYGIDERLFFTLQDQGVTATRRYALFGHSAGGQFVHRMLSFGYRDSVAFAISANAGTYAMPDLAIAWPFGLGETGTGTEELIALLHVPLAIMAGTEDTKVTGRFFPKGPRSMAQGGTRYERAHAYIRTGRSAASMLGTHCAWTLTDVPGVGHDGNGMSIAAAPIIAAAMRASAR